MKLKYFFPFITWIIPTIIITVVMSKLDTPLTTAQSYGMAALLISVSVTYYIGVRIAVKDKN